MNYKGPVDYACSLLYDRLDELLMLRELEEDNFIQGVYEDETDTINESIILLQKWAH